MLNFEYFNALKKLDIFKKSSQYICATPTDFAILLGTSIEQELPFVPLTERNGDWWTMSCYRSGDAYKVDKTGLCVLEEETERNIGIRPVINYSEIADLANNKIINQYGVLEVEYGEYPQTIVSDKLSELLSMLYYQKKLIATGKQYIVDANSVFESTKGFIECEIIEYEYKGNKYVCIPGNKDTESILLSNETKIEEYEDYWVQVEPIKWLIDEKQDIALAKNILLSGIQFNIKGWITTDFNKTNIKHYLDTYFAQNIIPSKVESNNEDISYNPYNFNFDEVSEEEIIKGCVESNIAVMLHGRSGDGKSARVKELDPDAEILYLINASPDSLGGKSVLVNDEMKDIPPTWYTKLVDKCEKEPNKIHIVFFDEITNAPPSIQGMAFNIILDKEVNGKWKLPDNARIVAAGNELEESMSSYGMSEPLFNRFAHVYIETKVEDWLSWASTPSEAYERLDYKKENVPMKIHPSVYAFIAYKGENALRTKYTGKTPNADPRKWELASKVLYETRKPEMLRSLVGESITREFTMFCRQRVITLEDVLSGNYTDSDLDMNTGEKYNTAVGLSSVSIEHFERVREFVKRLGPEICATFETLWAHGIEERLEKIQEIKLSERIK